MAYFEGIEMTGGYGNGPDIISSCSVNVNKGEIVSILGLMCWQINCYESNVGLAEFKIWISKN